MTQAPEGEGVGGVELPGDAGAAVAKDRLGAVALQLREGPSPFEVGGDAPGQRDHARGVGIFDAACQLTGPVQEPRSGPPVRAAGRSRVRRLHRQGPGDPRRLARGEREEQPPRLEVGPPDRVDDAQAGSGRPADIDPGQVGRGDLAGIALAEAEPSEPEAGPLHEQREQGLSGRDGQGHSDRLEDGPQRGEPFVDVAADQELHGGAALELDRVGDRGVGHRGQVGGGGLGTAAGVGQGVAQPGIEPVDRPCGARCRLELERAAIQAGRPVEGEGLGGFIGGPGEVIGRSLRLPRPEEMDAQHLGIGRARGLERQRQPPMMLARHLRLEPGHDGFPDPVVIGLDLVGTDATGAADQAGRNGARRATPAHPARGRRNG